jgi:hypothetical protein
MVMNLGSYKPSSWRTLPGMAVQGVTLKTEKGNIEVFLGPPSYVYAQKFSLMPGDRLEVYGFQVFHEDKAAFFAARVKARHQTLTLLDEQGMPRWQQQEKSQQRGGPGGGRGRRGGDDPSQTGGGDLGHGNTGWNR